MRGGTVRIDVVPVTDETLRERRSLALAQVGIPEAELRRRVADHSASYDEREAWSVVEEVNFLLDED